MSYEKRLAEKIRSICRTRGVAADKTRQLLFDDLAKNLKALHHNQPISTPAIDAQFGTGRISKKIASASLSDDISDKTVKQYYLQYCKNTTPLTVGDLEDFCFIYNKTPNELLEIASSSECVQNRPQKNDLLIMIHSPETIRNLLRSRKSYPGALNIVIASIPAIGISLKATIEKNPKVFSDEHTAYYYYCDIISNTTDHPLSNAYTFEDAWRLFLDELSLTNWDEYNIFQDIEELHDLHTSIMEIAKAYSMKKQKPQKIQKNTLDAKLFHAQAKAHHKTTTLLPR